MEPHLCTEGYITADMRKDKKRVKYLLFSKANKVGFPAVQLNFSQDNWDIEVGERERCVFYLVGLFSNYIK